MTLGSSPPQSPYLRPMCSVFWPRASSGHKLRGRDVDAPEAVPLGASDAQTFPQLDLSGNLG